MSRPMGLDYGLDGNARLYKRKHRWLFHIDDVSAGRKSGGIRTLPPSRAARPNLSFQEMNAKHLNEDVYYPAKPDWKPIQLTLYDLKTDDAHPVFEWVKKAYDPSPQIKGWFPSVGNDFIRQSVRLELYDGCGNTIEYWVYENPWPQSVNFMDLDMGSSEYLTCEITLRYVRAYVEEVKCRPELAFNQHGPLSSSLSNSNSNSS